MVEGKDTHAVQSLISWSKALMAALGFLWYKTFIIICCIEYFKSGIRCCAVVIRTLVESKYVAWCTYIVTGDNALVQSCLRFHQILRLFLKNRGVT